MQELIEDIIIIVVMIFLVPTLLIWAWLDGVYKRMKKVDTH